MSTNPVTITAPDGVPFIEFAREFDAPGEAYGFHGVFHVARPNDFIVQTFEFDGYPDVVSVESLRFEDLGGGRTRLVGHATYPSREARDGMVAAGMASGVTQGYERLDAVLSGLVPSGLSAG